MLVIHVDYEMCFVYILLEIFIKPTIAKLSFEYIHMICYLSFNELGLRWDYYEFSHLSPVNNVVHFLELLDLVGIDMVNQGMRVPIRRSIGQKCWIRIG